MGRRTLRHVSHRSPCSVIVCWENRGGQVVQEQVAHSFLFSGQTWALCFPSALLNIFYVLPPALFGILLRSDTAHFISVETNGAVMTC